LTDCINGATIATDVTRAYITDEA